MATNKKIRAQGGQDLVLGDSFIVPASGTPEFTGDVVVQGNLTVSGTTTIIDTVNLEVTDKLVTLNNGGVASSGGGSGIEIEENASITGYVKVSSDRNGWDLKAPSSANVITVPNDVGSGDVVLTAGTQTIGGTKTFSSTISGDIDGNAATVTNGVYTTGNQTIGGTKTFSSTISGSINGNAATVTNGVYTTGDQTIGGAKTFSGAVSTDAAHRGGYGLVPVGAIIAYSPGYFTSTDNFGYTNVGPINNTVTNVNAFLNSKGWYVCNGVAVNVAASPIWNAANRHVPSLDGGRFLRGSTTAGIQDGAPTKSIAHTHNFSLTVANLPIHDHSITHGHTASSNHTGSHFHAQKVSVAIGGTGTRHDYNGDGASTGFPQGISTDSAGAHSHTITVNNHTGNSGSTGSGSAVTTGPASVTTINVEPAYLNTFYIIRVF